MPRKKDDPREYPTGSPEARSAGMPEPSDTSDMPTPGMSGHASAGDMPRRGMHEPGSAGHGMVTASMAEPTRGLAMPTGSTRAAGADGPATQRFGPPSSTSTYQALTPVVEPGVVEVQFEDGIAPIVAPAAPAARGGAALGPAVRSPSGTDLLVLQPDRPVARPVPGRALLDDARGRGLGRPGLGSRRGARRAQPGQLRHAALPRRRRHAAESRASSSSCRRSCVRWPCRRRSRHARR